MQSSGLVDGKFDLVFYICIILFAFFSHHIKAKMIIMALACVCVCGIYVRMPYVCIQ